MQQEWRSSPLSEELAAEAAAAAAPGAAAAAEVDDELPACKATQHRGKSSRLQHDESHVDSIWQLWVLVSPNHCAVEPRHHTSAWCPQVGISEHSF